MEPPGEPPDRDSSHSNQSLTNYSGKVSVGDHSITEKLSRPMAFDKMERLVTEMQHEEIGVPVRSQKLFLTSIPSAFMGYDLIEWMMERLTIEESEALSIANQLCLHGYFFPVNDTKSLVVKDDSSLYRFQARYYWPWQCKAPDNLEYAIYLTKRTLRNKQRHGLEEYEVEALASLNKNLRAKWPLVTLQSGEELKLSKDRKKGDKIIGDSQERAFWRVHRPPPGQFTPLEPCPVPSRDRQGRPRKRTPEDLQREVDYLKSSLGRTRMKMSQACESLITYCETFSDYDFFIQSVLPSNPWVTDDITFWQLNNTIVDIPTEKRVKRWAISIEELVSDPTGLQEFTAYLRKEYSHENIRFWIAVNDLRRSAHSQIPRKVKEIYEEFLEPGAPCEINIDGKTMEKVQQGLKSPCRFTFDAAAEHIYALLLKKDCYPRFVRSEHYKSLLATGIQPSHKKRFFGFGVPKKKSSTAPPIQALLTQVPGPSMAPTPGNLSRRRGSDRSLSGSAHELAVSACIKDGTNKVPHSHSQSNLSDIPYSVVIYRGDMPSPGVTLPAMEDPNLTSTATGDANLKNPEGPKLVAENVASDAGACAVCPWEVSETVEPTVSVSVCPWESEELPQSSDAKSRKEHEPIGLSADISEVSDRMRRSCGLRQSTLDCDLFSHKKLAPVGGTEQRRASMTIPPRICDLQFSYNQSESPGNQSPISPKRIERPNTSQMTLSLTKTISFDNREELQQENPINVTSDECVTENLIKEQLSEINANDAIPKTTRDINLVKFSECDNLEKETALSEITSQSNVVDTTVNVSSTGITSTIPIVVCTVSESDSKCMDVDNDSCADDYATDTQIATNLNVTATDEKCMPQEELSPTTDEYQECCPPTDYQYDISTEGEILAPGCVAPAPTPAPSIAPLAEVEVDPPEDELETDEMETPHVSESAQMIDDAKTNVKQEIDGKSVAEKDVAETQSEEAQCRNAVCPWEDEDVTSDAPFVKTYATLGYL
ncbi:Regulator of G-protein signaling 7 [Pseudolycoriella hygida]|uniref:Regulator of G-protein signaling 7 n=1 Tax=Pseudolycoriella hygida TaxID=35572 RepID=A0A9Q0RZF3_9DIPT|nr:Regulator of G-protein signaling 7 [Pseudolycoriella hygida]